MSQWTRRRPALPALAPADDVDFLNDDAIGTVRIRAFLLVAVSVIPE